MKQTFVISAPVDTYSGYGARARDFVKSIIEQDKYEVKILSQRWGNTRKGFLTDHTEWSFITPHITPRLTAKPDIWCQVTVPNEFQQVGRYNMGLTAGIETTACAPQWIEGCNRMDLVLTSSEHSKYVFENTKYETKHPQTGQVNKIELTTPVEVLFEGVNLDVYKTLKTPMTNDSLFKSIDSIDEKFAYLFVGHWLQGELGHDRKNVGLMLRIFYETFKNKTNAPALILKTSCGRGSNMDRKEVMRRINLVKDSVPVVDGDKLPNVYLIHGDLSDEEMNELYNHSKVKAMVSCTKGEGFGRPLLEFAMVGKPIIASGWSGQIDFLDKNNSILIGGKLNEIHTSAIQKDLLIEGSKWFDIDQGQFHFALQTVKKDYKDWNKKSKIQAKKLRSKFSYNKMNDRIEEIITDNVRLPELVSLNLPKID
jgi:glycosyltransferase involved in cell wall biosynthesis